MPAPDSQEARRDGRLSTGLFWGGVGLAPLAALLLLVAPEGGLLRIAAVLAVLSVVLIGFSITLRNNTVAIRAELEETLYEEIDALRSDVRADIGTAARATHRAFGEKFQALSQQVQAMRTQLEGAPADAGRPGYERHAPVAGHGPAVAAIGAGRPAPSGGVVRHTETVQVTTRQTIVDPPHSETGRGGTVYGGGGGYRDASEEEDDWPEQRSRGDGRRLRAHDRGEEPAFDDRWSDVRAGDRWGAVRDDDRGREVRVGERRASLHADDSGTELRYEDRWASTRRDRSDDDSPGYGDPRRTGGHDDADAVGAYGDARRDAGYEGSRRDGGHEDFRRDGGYEDFRRDGGYEDVRRDGGYEGSRRGGGYEPVGGDAGYGGSWSPEAYDARGHGRGATSHRQPDPLQDDYVAGGLARDGSSRDGSGRDGSGRDRGRRGDRWREDRDAGWQEPPGARSDDRGADRAPAWSAEDPAPARDTRWSGRDGAWSDGGDSGWGGGDGGGGGGWSGGDNRWGGGEEPARPEIVRQRQPRALPALPAGGQQPGIWDGDWAEAERQPVGGRRRRDDESDYRYSAEPDDRWR